jgi:stage II sporulation protein D
MRKNIVIALACLLLWPFLANGTGKDKDKDKDKGKSLNEIRVLIAVIDKPVTIDGQGLKIKSKWDLGDKKDLSQILLVPEGGKLKVNDKEVKDTVRISSDNPINVNGKAYRGILTINKNGDNYILVNKLGLDDYLGGVVKNEMSSKWPPEALKAQTVLARTYAVKKILAPRTEFYDLVATVDDQVYSGMGLEDPASDQAIKETAGEVLYFGPDVAEVYYHSCCGGSTEPVEYVWGGSPRPYLGSVKCPYCQDCPNYFWRYPLEGAISPSELAKKLGYDGEEVSDMTIKEMSPGQRVTKLAVKFKSGVNAEISGNDFRVRLGRDVVKSTLFRPVHLPAGFVVFGSGSGHGAGLCQYGAKGMAEQDKGYKEILGYYFPGTELKKIY